MKRDEAHAEAFRRWDAVGAAYVVVRRKSTNVRNREVGYRARGALYIMGRGTTWEEAFADADTRGAA